MLRSILLCLSCAAVPVGAIADGKQRTAAPDGLIELRWLADFAVFIAAECSNFQLEQELNPRLKQFMGSLTESGVDFEAYDSVSADIPTFDGDSAKWLFARSDLADKIYPDGTAFCQIAEDVYVSDMLTGAMLRRLDPAGNS